MTTPDPTPIGETLEQLLDRVLFADPSTRRLRAEWEETKRREHEVYDRLCREEYERRLDYHRICQTPEPELAARRQTDLCTILFREELEERLAVRWMDILRRVQAVLADRDTTPPERPDTVGGDHSGGESGK